MGLETAEDIFMPGYEWMGAEERAALNALMDEGGVLFAHGFVAQRKRFHVREFEARLKDVFGAQDVLCVSSGTAAIKVALKAMGVGPGDEVITQSFNFIAGLEAIVDCGATPVITGIDDSLNMDVAHMQAMITPRTRAIMPVHMLGVPADIQRINQIARARGIPVLEDACEALGARIGQGWAGAAADIGVFSFDFGKTITTGEGGAVLTQKSPFIDRARQYHDHGHMNLPQVPRGQDTAGLCGFNFRMSELNAVVGKAQLEKMQRIVDESQRRYLALDAALSDRRWCHKRVIPHDVTPSFDTYVIEVPDEKRREQVIAVLKAQGFGTKNLPDAMRWHCSAYWGHMGFDHQTPAQLAALAKLQRQVAVPIVLGRGVAEYTQLGAALEQAAAS